MALTGKDTIRVMIITKDHRISGDMHVLEGSRLTDALNSKSKDFYAITSAEIYRLDTDQLMARAEYMAVAREAISAIFPVEDA